MTRSLGGTPAKCSRCGADIVFARTVAGPNGPGGKTMPLDPNDDPKGNVAVRKAGPGRLLCRVLTKGETPDLTIEHLAMPHFATCTADKPTQPALPGVEPIGKKPPAPTATLAAPKRIECTRANGWQLPANTVYVDVPSRFANGFVVGHEYRIDGERIRVLNRPHATDLYRQHQAPEDTALARRELAGKNLACWCPIGTSCHADILLEIANTAPAVTP